MSDSSHFYACIMAGGSGERFWPMSRARTPKHLLKLFSDRTLVEDTVRRLDGVVPMANVFVLTNTAQLETTRAALKGVIAEANIIAEPAKRDTAAAAALATALVRARDPQGDLALLQIPLRFLQSLKTTRLLQSLKHAIIGRRHACGGLGGHPRTCLRRRICRLRRRLRCRLR